MSLAERMDPRVSAFVAAQPASSATDVASREELLAEAASEDGRSTLAAEAAFMETGDDEAIAPSTGLRLAAYSVLHPAGHSIRLYLSAPTQAPSSRASTTCTAAPWHTCHAPTATTGPGLASSPPEVSLSSWSTTAIASRRPRCPRSRPTRRV